METRASYALIGAFTLAVIAAALGFVFWFTGGGKEANRKTYRVVFTSSVSGLARGSLVLFNGLRVGDVTTIDLGDDPRQVFAMIVIDKRTPVKVDTKARLEYQGLTGVASVALSGGSAESPQLEQGEDDQPPTIAAEQSDFQNIVATLQNLSTKVDGLLDRINHLVGDNSDAITGIVQNVNTFSKALADNSNGISQLLGTLAETGKSVRAFVDVLNRNSDNIDGIVKNARNITAQFNTTAGKLDGLIDQARGFLGQPGQKGMFDDVGDAARAVRDLARNLDTRTKDLAAGLKGFTGPGLRQYEALAADSRRTLNEVNRTVESLQKNPQQLLFGSRPAVPEYSGR